MKGCESRGKRVPLTAALIGDLGLIADTLMGASAAVLDTVRPPAAKESSEVAVATGEDAVELSAQAWRSIENAGGAATPFQTLAVARRAAAAHVRRGEIPRVVVTYDGGRPCVVFPTAIGRWGGIRTIRFLGDPMIQYGDVVAAPHARPEHLAAAWRAAADPAAGRLIYLRKVRMDARIAPVLSQTARVVAEYEAPFVDARREPAASSRDLRELRRFRRRLSEIGETRFEIRRGAAAGLAIREALNLKRAWLRDRGLGSSVIGDPHWERAMLALAEAPELRAATLAAGDRIAAVEIGFEHRGCWHAFLGATDPGLAKAGPGHVQMAETIAYCRSAGLSTYDLLAPADAYKRTLAHGSAAVRDHAAALGGTGWFGLMAARAVPAAKDLISRLPPGLRRTLSALRRG